MSDDLERIKKKALLQSYYQNSNANGQPNIADTTSVTTTSSSSLNGVNNNTISSLNSKDSSTNQMYIYIKDPYDLNTTSFEPDLYLKKLIKVSEVFNEDFMNVNVVRIINKIK